MWTTVSFSIAMPLEYKTVLLVVNCVTKSSWYHNYFLHKEIHIQIFFKLALVKLNSHSIIKLFNKNVNKKRKALKKCRFKTKEAGILFYLTSGNNTNGILLYNFQ